MASMPRRCGKGGIPGDFFGRDDVIEHGWTPAEGYQGFFLRGASRVREFCETALALLAAGKKVLIDYDSIAIGGSEGYVSLYTKEA